MTRVAHKSLPKLVSVFHTEKTLYIVMEPVITRNLFQYLSDKKLTTGTFPIENEVKNIFGQLVDSINYLHAYVNQ